MTFPWLFKRISYLPYCENAIILSSSLPKPITKVVIGRTKMRVNTAIPNHGLFTHFPLELSRRPVCLSLPQHM